MSIGVLCELARDIVREAEDEYRLADTREARMLLGYARTFAGEVTIYVERLKAQGAQVELKPPPRGES